MGSTCVNGSQPGATLLFPYFEVDPSAAGIDPQTLVLTGQVAVEVSNGGTVDAVVPFEVTIFEDLDRDGVLGGADNPLGTVTYALGLLVGETATIDVPVAGTLLFDNNLLYAFADSGEVIAERWEGEWGRSVDRLIEYARY